MSNLFQGQCTIGAQRDERVRSACPELSVTDGVDGELHYAPHRLLDAIRNHLRLKNDAALCRRLAVRPPVISKVRNWHTAVSADLLISMHEESGLTIRHLRLMMGDRREKFNPIILKEIVGNH